MDLDMRFLRYLQTFGRWCKDTPGWWVPLSFRRSFPCHCHSGEAIEAAGLLAARFRLAACAPKPLQLEASPQVTLRSQDASCLRRASLLSSCNPPYGHHGRACACGRRRWWWGVRRLLVGALNCLLGVRRLLVGSLPRWLVRLVP